MLNLCIIPARSGSKRIPRKNIKTFLGKPIIAYSIEEAIKSNLFSEIMVSTDDDEIANIANSYGAKTTFKRSKKNSDDNSTTYDVLEEVISEYLKIKLYFQNACCIYPCAPLLSKENLNNAYNLLTKSNFDCIFPIVKYATPIQRAYKIEDGNLTMFYPENADTRSQDLEAAYFDAGQFYWFDTAKIIEAKTLITNNSGTIVINEMEAQDIDNEMDWQMAELKYKYLKLRV